MLVLVELKGRTWVQQWTDCSVYPRNPYSRNPYFGVGIPDKKPLIPTPGIPTIWCWATPCDAICITSNLSTGQCAKWSKLWQVRVQQVAQMDTKWLSLGSNNSNGYHLICIMALQQAFGFLQPILYYADFIPNPLANSTALDVAADAHALSNILSERPLKALWEWYSKDAGPEQQMIYHTVSDGADVYLC